MKKVILNNKVKTINFNYKSLNQKIQFKSSGENNQN